MSTARHLHYSYDDYFRASESTSLKLEYCDGVIYAMAGGSPTHAALTNAVASALTVALRGVCTVYSSDLRVRVDASDLFTYPDASVVCGAPQLAQVDRNSVTNPSVIVEVTSPSTEEYDRGEKLNHYKQLHSLQAVLFVSHAAQRITVVERTVAGWTERDFRSGETVTLSTPRCHFTLDSVYENLTL